MKQIRAKDRRNHGGKPATRHPMSRWIGLFVVVAVLLIVVGAGWRPLAIDRGWLVSGGASTVPASMFSPTRPAVAQGAGVIDPVPSPVPPRAVDQAKLDAAFASVVKNVPGDYASYAIDLATGKPVWDSGGNALMIPASNLKLMTGTALIDKIGPHKRFATTVVAGPPGHIVLVGGGDPLLASTTTSYRDGYPKLATLDELASSTAAALKAQGQTSVQLGFDESLFTGPRVNPGWLPDDLNYVARISALMVDEASGSASTDDPGLAAATAFAIQLRNAGVNVEGPPAAMKAPDDAHLLAQVWSLPASEIAQQAFTYSDNTVAEVMLRQLALAYGQPASFAGGAAALTAALAHLGLWTPGMVIVDGSGLALANRLTTQSLATAIAICYRRPELRGLLAGLPVAGATGTLGDRYTDDLSSAGRGMVRAKTGTLSHVSALTGYAPTRDGGVVAFSIIGNHTGDQNVQPYLDHWASALADCTCGG